ncbi:MAG: Capsule biosynthesis protein CapA [candidate division WS2 bacterium]|nr:Capsule biosynthesis protein CapA [Candidatus Psychracetigena formicireducens]
MRHQKHYFKLFILIALILVSGVVTLLFTLNQPRYWIKHSLYIPSHLTSKITFTDTFSLAKSPRNATHILTPSLNSVDSLLKIKLVIACHPLLTINDAKFLTVPEYLKEASLVTDKNNIISIDSLEGIKKLVMQKSYWAIIPIEYMSPPLKIFNLVDIYYKVTIQKTSWWQDKFTQEIINNIVIISDDEKQVLTTLAFVGDVMLSRRVGLTIKRRGLEYPFLNIREELSKYDLVFGNLESVISDQGIRANQPITFRASPDTVNILKDAGFSIVSLANNHAVDYGKQALLDCLRILKENSIKAVGAGRNIAEASSLKYIEVNGIKIGFIAYNLVPPLGLRATKYYPGVNYLKYESIAKEIPRLSKMVDLLIVSLHWGVEYQQVQTKEQEEIANELLRSGAHIIIGHHPHVLQPIYIFNEKNIVAYSLGNFIFDQDFSEETSTGGVLLIQLYGKKVVGLEFKPTYIFNDQLHWISDQLRIEKINSVLKFQSLENVNTP